jgi:hypothetical protein
VTLSPAKPWFKPFALGASLNNSFSFSPFTFVTGSGGGKKFIARFEEDHSSHIASDISATTVEVIADLHLPFYETLNPGIPVDFYQNYFLLRSSGESQAAISGPAELLQSFFVICKDSEGCSLYIWTRTGGKVISAKCHVSQGITLICLECAEFVNLQSNDLDPCAAPAKIVFVAIESCPGPSSAFSSPILIKPAQPHGKSDDPQLVKYLPISLVKRHLEQGSLFVINHTDCTILSIANPSCQDSALLARITSDYFDGLLGEKNSPNPRHLSAMIASHIGKIDRLPLLARDLDRSFLEKLPARANENCKVNYLVVMTPRSGSTALSEKLANLGIGSPTELSTPYFYNLLSHLEALPDSQGYIEYVLDLLRDSETSVSGIQIDSDRLRTIWKDSIETAVSKHIYFFRRSISKQALSLSLAVHYNLWFSYGPDQYNASLDSLTLDQFRDQLARIARMNAYCLTHYLENREKSIIITNEQHLASFDDHAALILQHIGAPLTSSRAGASVWKIAEKKSLPTQEIGGRNQAFSAVKVARFLEELNIVNIGDTLVYADTSCKEVEDLYLRIFVL